MVKNEQTRIREHGTEVTNPANFPDAGIARINALRAIVENKQYAKIDGIMMDLFTSSLIVQVYDAINEAQKIKYRNVPVTVMAGIAFKLTSK